MYWYCDYKSVSSFFVILLVMDLIEKQMFWQVFYSKFSFFFLSVQSSQLLKWSCTRQIYVEKWPVNRLWLFFASLMEREVFSSFSFWSVIWKVKGLLCQFGELSKESVR